MYSDWVKIQQMQEDQAFGYDVNSAQYRAGAMTTPGGVAYLGNSPDSYVNALNQEKTWLREDLIRKEQYAREDNAYANLFGQLKSLGVNPALLLSSVGPTVGSAGGYSTSAFKTSNVSTNDRTDQANSAKVAGSILAALALIIAAFA